MDIVAPEHEQVVYRHDRASGLRALIAVHDTRLGPAAGGCRYWAYPSPEAGLEDVLRLSRGMTLKNALADIPFGGGKSVILGAPGRRPTEAQLLCFGDWIEALGGAYITAEDVGMRVADLRTISRRTHYVSGLGRTGIGGDPSPATAEGVFLGLATAVRMRLKSSSLAGVRVAVQGLGSVGYHLCRHLHRAGAELLVADLDADLVARAVKEFNARSLHHDAVLAADVDVFAPCALGGVLSEDSVERLRASVVAGSANNQLATPAVGDWLAERGVLYAPDYVINAGGVISVAAEYLGRDLPWVRDRILAIPERLEQIFGAAAGGSTEDVARKLAERVLARGDAALSGDEPPVDGAPAADDPSSGADSSAGPPGVSRITATSTAL